MNTIIEQALQLPKEEKLELYYALQENLDEEAGEEELTKEQWKQLNDITEQIDKGTIKKISELEMMTLMKQKRNGL